MSQSDSRPLPKLLHDLLVREGRSESAIATAAASYAALGDLRQIKADVAIPKIAEAIGCTPELVWDAIERERNDIPDTPHLYH